VVEVAGGGVVHAHDAALGLRLAPAADVDELIIGIDDERVDNVLIRHAAVEVADLQRVDLHTGGGVGGDAQPVAVDDEIEPMREVEADAEISAALLESRARHGGDIAERRGDVAAVGIQVAVDIVAVTAL